MNTFALRIEFRKTLDNSTGVSELLADSNTAYIAWIEKELTATRAQRDRLAAALKLCRQRVVGECGFYWENTTYTYKSRDYIADVCEQALQYLNKNES